MKEHNLSFGKILILQNDLAEVIVDDMVEMDMTMVEEYHQFLLNNLSAPFSLLINKKNSYTYTFDAQLELATLKEIYAMAVVTYNSFSTRMTEDLIEMPRKSLWQVQLFDDRQAALKWLESKQMEATATSI